MKISTLCLLVLSLTFSLPAFAAGDAAKGKAHFDMFCATCHGATGAGDGAAAATLDPKPKDLTKTAKSDADLTKTIKEGGAAVGLSALMPAWGGALSDADIGDVVAYIRSLKK